MGKIKHGVGVCRLGYDAVTVYRFPTAGHVCVFTGSSLNRKKYENKKKDEVTEQAPAAFCKEGDDIQECGSGDTVDVVRDDKDCKQRVEGIRKKKMHSISRSGKRLIRARGAAMFRVGRCKTIVTLSFINNVTDRVAIICLQNFIRSWRKQYGESINYLWVAERQQNGNVHFHILTSHFFDIKKENARWVRVQYNQGIVFNSAGCVLSRNDVEDAIRAGRLQELLNPFDVKRITTQSGVISYLTKYITKGHKKKDDRGRKMDEFEFMPWRCSNRVSKVFTGVLSQIETFDVMRTEKNVRVQAKDYFKDGKLKYPRGYVHKPVPWYGLWASKVAVYDTRLADGQYNSLDKMNMDILTRGVYNGEVLRRGGSYALDKLNEFNYFNEYCREITEDVVRLSSEPYENNFVGVTDTFYRDDEGNIRCNSFDGAIPVPGRYHLRDGSYYEVGRWTKDELIRMESDAVVECWT